MITDMAGGVNVMLDSGATHAPPKPTPQEGNPELEWTQEKGNAPTQGGGVVRNIRATVGPPRQNQ